MNRTPSTSPSSPLPVYACIRPSVESAVDVRCAPSESPPRGRPLSRGSSRGSSPPPCAFSQLPYHRSYSSSPSSSPSLYDVFDYGCDDHDYDCEYGYAHNCASSMLCNVSRSCSPSPSPSPSPFVPRSRSYSRARSRSRSPFLMRTPFLQAMPMPSWLLPRSRTQSSSRSRSSSPIRIPVAPVYPPPTIPLLPPAEIYAGEALPRVVGPWMPAVMPVGEASMSTWTAGTPTATASGVPEPTPAPTTRAAVMKAAMEKAAPVLVRGADPELLTYRFEGRFAYVPGGKTYDAALDFVATAFPSLSNTPRARISLHVIVIVAAGSGPRSATGFGNSNGAATSANSASTHEQEVIVRVSPPAWPGVVRDLNKYEVVVVQVDSERCEPEHESETESESDSRSASESEIQARVEIKSVVSAPEENTPPEYRIADASKGTEGSGDGSEVEKRWRSWFGRLLLGFQGW